MSFFRYAVSLGLAFFSVARVDAGIALAAPAAAAPTTTTTTTTVPPPPPRISLYQGMAMRVNATSPVLAEACEGGMLAAVSRVFGLTVDLGELLGGLLPTYAQENAAAYLTTLRRGAPTTREEKVVKQMFGKLTDKDILALAGLSHFAAEVLKSPFVEYPGMTGRFADLLRQSAGEQEEVALNFQAVTEHHSNLRRLQGLPDLQGLLKDLAPLVLHLLSPFFSAFVAEAIGSGTGWTRNDPKKGATAQCATGTDGFVNSGRRLLDVMGSAVETAVIADDGGSLTYEPNVRAGIGLVGAFLACADETVFDATKICAAASTEPTPPMYDTVCDMWAADKVASLKDLQKFDGPVPAKLEWLPSEEITNVPSVTTDERFLHFALFRGVTRSMEYASTTYACSKDDLSAKENLVPGWDLDAVFTYYSPGSIDMATRPKKDNPLALALRPQVVTEETECQTIVLVRGTINAYEWANNIDITPVPLLGSTDIRAHRGLYRLAQSIFPGFKTHLTKKIRACAAKQKTPELLVAGHSLGGGVAALLGVMSKFEFADTLDVSVAAYAPPSTLNRAGVEWMAANVNTRNVVASHDPVPSAPISFEATPYGMPRYGFGMTHDGAPAQFSMYPGFIELDMLKYLGPTESLGLNNSMLWLALAISGKNTMLPPLSDQFPDPVIPAGVGVWLWAPFAANVNMAAAHVCSYACITSLTGCKAAGDPAAGWMCQPHTCPGIMEPIKFETSIELPK